MSERRSSRWPAPIGMRHAGSPTACPAAATWAANAGSLSNSPAIWPPSAVTMLPVSVARSTMADGRRCAHRPGQRVGQHQPALRIGVDHLDRGAVAHAQHVGRAVAGGPGRVLRHGEHGDGRGRGSPPGQRQHRPGAGGGTRHVGPHLLHARGRLDAEAPGVEGDPLADEHHRVGAGRAGPAQHDQARRVGGPAPTASNPPSPARRSALPFSTSIVHPRLGQGREPLDEAAGVSVLDGSAHQVARERDARQHRVLPGPGLAQRARRVRSARPAASARRGVPVRSDRSARPAGKRRW